MDADRTSPTPASDPRPSLHVLRVTLPASPSPLVLRRDLPPPPIHLPARPSKKTSKAREATERISGPLPGAIDPADVLRYVSAARHSLRGPLVALFEGPGDPLASASHVLRALALLRDHDPDVMTGLVVDGPLVGEYVDELVELGLHHVVVRMDAASVKAAWRVYGRVVYRGETIVGPDAGRLVLEEGRRAVRILVANRIPVAIRFTAIPTVNIADLPSVAAFAASAGAERLDVVPHRPTPRAPLEKAGAPTASEMAGYRETVRAAFDVAYQATFQNPEEAGIARAPGALSWFADGRLRDVPLASLEHLEGIAMLPDPDQEPRAATILPARRARVVAVATSDGHFVDRTLVDTAHLQVYAVDEERTRWLGTRALPAGFLRRRDGVGTPKEFLLAVAGCHAVVATRFTKRAAVLLDAVGIRAHTAGGRVDDVLDRVSRGTLHEPGHEDPSHESGDEGPADRDDSLD